MNLEDLVMDHWRRAYDEGYNQGYSDDRADVLDALKEMQLSLDALYKEHPVIAGEFFGACMAEKNKALLRGIK